ncbi:MAG: type 1 fimbrial protein [Achromobacter sp.]|jgi:major type 1 subunit fimbrin (pilin)|uniref:Major fimbrial subunit SMF-1 n=1 Tax=Achromobacter insuavis TaxID=1287735 RepID=A0A6J4ZVC3_9BURK|nr:MULTISPECIES: fimbrial protein [Achromobacter]MBN9639191.1 type 1 fimbrial protein [Achromobacter sp.]CAB3644419.1 Major fimbrial subunit SMF-1 [Achromobacter insuavis]CUI36243.1 S-fimbrillin [Achromobacter sp. 2789STDY5608628]CUI51628.1 S-fimbrillin [Achromobacter sp. 2789STDY5608633]CUJ60735.1 S-fimbrillin [Achromobacter sp. 2789STDY5608621]
MKTSLYSALFLAVGALASQSAFAVDGTITFNGSITDTTCKINGQDNGDFTVTLPSVSKTRLANPGATAGPTAFSISLTNCTGSATKVSTYFEPGSTVRPNGNLKNTAAGGAANVEVQLLNKGDNTPIVVGAAAAAQNSAPVNLTGGSATLSYVAQYFAAGAVDAGPVTTTVTYTLAYQ